MKKVLISLLAVLLAFAFVGCKDKAAGGVTVKDDYLRIVSVDKKENTTDILFEFTADKDYGSVEYSYSHKSYNSRKDEMSTGGELAEFNARDIYLDFIKPSSHPTQAPVVLNKLYGGDRLRFYIHYSHRVVLQDNEGQYFLDVTLHQIVIRSVDNPENSYTYTFE